MISTLMYKPHVTCLSTDIVIQNDKTLTTDPEINKVLTNGAEVYCIDTSECYLYDEENKTLIKNKTNNDIFVDGEITPESVNIINNKVDNFIADINEKIAQADINKIVELTDRMDVAEDNIDDLNVDKTNILSTIGDGTMGTTATTLKGAIAEHEGDISGITTQLNAMAKYFEFSPQEDVNIQIPSGEITAITNYANISSEDFSVYENKYFKPFKKGIYLITVQFPFYNLPSGAFGRALIHVVRNGGTEQRYHLGTTVGGDTWNPVANTTTIKINSDDVFYFSAFQNSGNSITQATQIVRIIKLKEV